MLTCLLLTPSVLRRLDTPFLWRRGFLTPFGSTQHIFLKGNAAAKLFIFFFLLNPLSTAN